MDPVWNRETEEVVAALGSHSGQGLTAEEARRRLAEQGPNVLPKRGHLSIWKLLGSQFSSLMVWLLIAAAATAGLLGEAVDAWAIVAIVLFNALLGFFQEFRAESSLEALQELSSPSSKVIREGRLKIIPSSELVMGDLILLEAGDKIPADGRIVDLARLSCDEASLTGESVAVSKTVDVVEASAGIADRKNMVFRGTAVASGKGRAVVTQTGLNTEMGSIATGLIEHKREPTPLQGKLDQLGRALVYICLGIVGVVFGLGLFRGLDLVEMLLIALSLAVAAIPEGLPAAVTISLSIGVRKMAEKQALVRRLSSVETLGSTTVICTDKTGTLTQSAMTVKQVFVDNQLIEVSGSGYAPEGEFDRKTPGLEMALQIAALCNSAGIFQGEKGWECAGDPTECALLTVALKGGVDKEELDKRYPLIEEIPFDSDRKMMSVKRGEQLYCKGAADVLVERCRSMLINGEEAPLDRKRVLEVSAHLASEAYRVLAVAYQSDLSKGEEKEMVFVGLMAMIDPPRPEVKKAIAECREAGIRTLMVTGDHKKTAEAIARELEMEIEKTAEGKEMDQLSDEEIRKVTLFSRISAAHKLRIVKALQEAGNVTAMTGDGVNDAPAVQAADIGIAMGMTGTDVTKQSADMIILDDNFASIVRAVKQGRGIYDNIVKFVSYLLSSNLAEILVIFIAMLLALTGPDGRAFVPLLPVQLLWMNLVTDGFPAISLALDPLDPRAMKRPPRSKDEEILNRRFSLFIVSISLLVTAGALGACFWGLRQSVALAQTMTFTTLIVLELVRAQMIRRQYQLTLFSNHYLIAALASSLLLQLLALYIPSLQIVFGTVALGWIDWAIIAGIGAALWWLGIFVTKLFYRE